MVEQDLLPGLIPLPSIVGELCCQLDMGFALLMKWYEVSLIFCQLKEDATMGIYQCLHLVSPLASAERQDGLDP